MTTQIAHDLCAARQKAGLTLRDLCILLEISSKEVAALETGDAPPSAEQLCRLSIIYGRSFTEHYQELMQDARQALFCNLPSLPELPEDEHGYFNRENTLKRLDRELSAALTRTHARS